jgi:hypothetical protein
VIFITAWQRVAPTPCDHAEFLSKSEAAVNGICAEAGIPVRAFGWQLGKAHREGRKGIARQQAGEMLE